MGHRTRQLTILHNGASAHTLDDPPGLFDESGICDLDHHPFPSRAGLRIGFYDLAIICLHPIFIYCSQDLGRACMDLLGISEQRPVWICLLYTSDAADE